MEALTIAKYVLKYSNAKGYVTTNLKLNKLLYYIEKEHRIRYSIKCFNDDIVWCRHGVIVKEVYHYFNLYSALWENLSEGVIFCLFNENEDDINSVNCNTKVLINEVVDKYKDCDGWDMTNSIKSEIGDKYKKDDIISL